MPQALPSPSVDSEPLPAEDYPLEAAIEAAIEACEGNLRETVRALVIAIHFLEGELAEARGEISHGYVREQKHLSLNDE